MALMANEEMAAAWEHEAEGWLAHAERYERAGRGYWEHFQSQLSVPREAQVLDIGCGSGTSTIAVARLASAGAAVGIDISARMVDHARRTAEIAGVQNVGFVHGDAQVHPFEPGSFDLAMSVFGGMFFGDPTAAFANVARGLRPGGRLAMLVWRRLADNEWLCAIREALALGRQVPEPPSGAPGPFAFDDPDQVRSVLTAANFGQVEVERVDQPMDFGADADDAFEFLKTFGITRGLTESLGDDERRMALDALRQTVVDHESTAGVRFGSSAWLVTARTDSNV